MVSAVLRGAEWPVAWRVRAIVLGGVLRLTLVGFGEGNFAG